MSRRLKHSASVLFHLIAAITILMLAQLSADLVNALLPTGSLLLDPLIFTAVYIALTLTAGSWYAKYILHFKLADTGLQPKAPPLKWILAEICLPLAVTIFYLAFVPGQIVKNEQAASLSFYLLYAAVYAGLAPGICEEFIFRGLIMRTLERQWNQTAAVIVPSVFFALLHTWNMRLGLVDFLLLLIAGTSVGIMFSLIALQSGSIWSGAAVHALWNAVILGGVFVIQSPSGGAADFFYKYELSSSNVLLTGGRFGIESALPAIIGYCLVSALAVRFNQAA